MIRNADGSPYEPAGCFSLYDPTAPEHDLFNLWDEEAIRQGGSPVYYHEVFLGEVDPQYLEARGKLFSQFPVELYATYEPVRSQNYINTFGIDSEDEMIFEMNYQAVLNKIGHAPKIGSRIYTPHLQENWVIIQNNLGEFKMWGALRLQIIAKRFQESTTTNEGKVTQPDYKIV